MNKENNNDMGEDSGLVLAMAALAAVPALIGTVNQILACDISLPNIPIKVNDRNSTIWRTLAENGGWCLQQNGFTKHCRILDAEDVRQAWGTKNGMLKALETIKDQIE